MSASPAASASATPEVAAATIIKPTIEEGSSTPEPQTQDKGKGKATDEVWDPSAQTLPDGSKPSEGTATASGTATPAAVAPVAAVAAAAPAADPSNPWQAVWSAESNGTSTSCLHQSSHIPQHGTSGTLKQEK